MVKRVFLRQVLEEMKKTDSKGEAVSFSIAFRTFNKNNKMGGVLKEYSNAKLLILKPLKGKVFDPRDTGFREIRKRRNPNHWENRTRNIEIPSGHIKKINIMLITKFNDLEVIN